MNELNKNVQIRPSLWLAVILLATLIAYIPSVSGQFINWDDPTYVINNDHIKSLSFKNLINIFASFPIGNYTPLTVYSFTFDYLIGGLNPAIYHLVNLSLHLLNTFLVFAFIRALCGRFDTALLTSALFALHPMHVESVAWISQRKDVLFLFFYLLSLIFYCKSSNTKTSILVFVFYILSVLSKPTAVSLPLVLCLIDAYQNNNFRWKYVLNKWPFFIVSLLMGIIALSAAGIPMMWSDPFMPDLSVVHRAFLVSYAIVMYLGKTMFPFYLNGLYGLDVEVSNGVIVAANLMVLFLCLLIYKGGKIIRFAFGFFFITIFVNLPIFKAGYALMADRFTYLPYIGLFFGFSHIFINQFNNYSQKIKRIWFLGIVLLLTSFAILTWRQTYVWQNNFSFWQAVYRSNPIQPIAVYNRGRYFFSLGQFDRAIEEFTKAIQIEPEFTQAYNRLALTHLLMNKHDLAIKYYTIAIRLDGENKEAYFNRGACYQMIGQLNRAISDYKQVTYLDRSDASAYRSIRKLVEKQLITR